MPWPHVNPRRSSGETTSVSARTRPLASSGPVGRANPTRTAPSKQDGDRPRPKRASKVYCWPCFDGECSDCEGGAKKFGVHAQGKEELRCDCSCRL